MNRFVPKIKFKEKVNNIPWESSVTRRLMVKKNRKYKLYRTSVNQLKTLRVDDPNFYNVSTRVSLNFQKFRTASDEYKKVTRREKNRYLHTLKSVWSNPDIPTRKKFSILKKLSKSEKSNYIPPLIENNETIHESEKRPTYLMTSLPVSHKYRTLKMNHPISQKSTQMMFWKTSTQALLNLDHL